MPESLLIKLQAGGLQPDLMGDCDADFFPVNVEEFSKGLVKPIGLAKRKNSKKRKNRVR